MEGSVRPRPGNAALLGFVVALVFPAGAWPAPSGALEEARRLIRLELRYEDGIALIERALAEPALSDDERVEAYLLLGIAHVAGGAEESAEAAFRALLKLRPDYALDPLLSPKIRKIYERVQKALTAPVRIFDARFRADDGRLAFNARLEDRDDRAESVELWVRIDSSAFELHPVSKKGDLLASGVDVDRDRTSRVDYYLVAKSGDGRTLFELGGPASPLSLILEGARPGLSTPPSEESSSVLRHWWFWTAVGVVLISAGGVAYFASRGRSDAPPGTLPPIYLE